MFEFSRHIANIVLGNTGWWMPFRLIVIVLCPVLLPIALIFDVVFGILYELVNFYYYLVT